MTVNLQEFMKVFTIVFATSGLILSLRHFIVNYNEYEEETEELNNHVDINFKSNNPDFIDYDGMGNQGRFPTTNKGVKT